MSLLLRRLFSLVAAHLLSLLQWLLLVTEHGLSGTWAIGPILTPAIILSLLSLISWRLGPPICWAPVCISSWLILQHWNWTVALPSQGYHSLSASSHLVLDWSLLWNALVPLGGLTPHQLLPPSLLEDTHFFVLLKVHVDLVPTPFSLTLCPAHGRSHPFQELCISVIYLSTYLSVSGFQSSSAQNSPLVPDP